jgi:pSer/pThr/pTyr-binding forkhead associated (FHA) protein
MKKNPFEFIEMLQKINQQVATEICQWTYTQRSLKQRRIENAHLVMINNLEPEIQAYGIRIGIKNFLQSTTYLTRSAVKFFAKLESTNPDVDVNNMNEIDFTDLFIRDRIVGNNNVKLISNNSNRKEKLRVKFTAIDNGRKFFETKTVSVNNLQTCVIKRANSNFHQTHSNLYFAHQSVAENHAELMYIDKKLYIRDLGSASGTWINEQKIGRNGVPWTPKQLADGDTLIIGDIKMTVNFVNENENESDISAEKESNSTRKTIIRVQCENDKIPTRFIELVEQIPIVFGRPRITSKPQISNGLFVSSGLSYNQARLWISRNNLYIATISRSYPTILNNKKVTAPTEVKTGDTLTLGSNVSLKIFFEPPSNGVTIEHFPMISLVQADKYSKDFQIKELQFDNNNQIVIGRSLFDCKSLAKKHAIFNCLDGRVTLQDCNTLNGTFVTRASYVEQLKAHESYNVQPGEIIQFGSSTERKNYIRASLHIDYNNSRPIHRCNTCYKQFSTAQFARRHLSR